MSTIGVLKLGNTFAQCILGDEMGGPPIVIIQGATGPVWTVTIKKADDSIYVFSLATFSAVLYDRRAPAGANGQVLVGSGGSNGWTVSSPVFTFTPAAADVAVPGEYMLELELITGKLGFVRVPVSILPRFGP